MTPRREHIGRARCSEFMVVCYRHSQGRRGIRAGGAGEEELTISCQSVGPSSVSWASWIAKRSSS